MSKCPWFALVGLLSVSVTAHTTPQCPGTAASVHARHLMEYLNIIDVFVNHAGPYPFLLDTAAQITSVDSALASELHLKLGDAGNLFGVSSHQAIRMAQVDDIRVGDRNLTPSVVAVQPLRHLQSADPSVRGVLGGDFLRHFDVLIDHANALLCLGKAGDMRSHIHGEQLAFAAPHATDGVATTEPLIVSAHLSKLAGKSFLLLLDSGANAPFLWKLAEVPVRFQGKVVTDSTGTSAYIILPAQDMQLGNLLVHRISFATPADRRGSLLNTGVDGLLPTAQFRRVYIDYVDRFVVLEPW